MAVEESVAQDQIRAFVERIERLEEEKKAIAEDIKSIYSEARGNGFDVKILRRVVGIRKQDANERMEQEAILELYMSALGMIEAPEEEVYDGERERLNSIAAQLRAAPTKPKAEPLAALRADPAMAIVAPADITPTPQPTKAAGSDLTSLAPHEGQVAPIQETQHEGSAGQSEELAQSNADDAGEVEEPFKAGTSPAPKYAAPGIVTWECGPPEGVGQHEYSKAFGTLGQDLAVIEDDLSRLASAPIQKIGNVILDGWARYNKARGMFTEVLEDGVTKRIPIEYPVVQYDGTDPLLDCIRWNIAGRILSDKDKQTVVARLIAIEPKRKADIIKAVAELAI